MSTPTTPRPIAELDVEPQQVDEIEDLRTHLPLLDPDRHALDTEADVAFARIACEYPGGAA
jgi:hypothetical protein